MEWFTTNQESEATKPYVRSIPLVMGVELKVEVMDNAQERLCHWLHVLCTPNIR
jgi:hypothetical protein